MESEYIRNVLLDTNSDNVIILDKYHNLISFYISFLHGRMLPIHNSDLLVSCLDMATYFIDNDYFQSVIQQLLNGWYHLSPLVYTDLHPDLQRSVYLYLYLPPSSSLLE